MPTTSNPNIQVVTADWKDIDGLIESFQDALTKLGISMIDHPDFNGSDTFGFLLSNRPLTPAEIKDQSIDQDLVEDTDENEENGNATL